MAAHPALRDGMQGVRRNEWLMSFARSTTQQTARKASAHWVATKSRARGVALLGIVVSATTFVVLLAIIVILSATRLMENLIRGSLKG
jgi:hypothetical protein